MVRKHSSSFFLLFCLAFSLAASAIVPEQAADPDLYIGRITPETVSSHVPGMNTFLLKRSIIRNSIYVVGVIGAIAILNSVLNNEIDKQHKIKADQLDKVVQNVEAPLNPNAGFFSTIWSWAKSVPTTTGSLFKATVPFFLVNSILASGWSRVQGALSSPIQDESLQWYCNNYTNIEEGFAAIKLNAVPLDQDSFYLNFETNQMGQKVALRGFIQEVKDAVSKKDAFLQSFLPLEVVKKYVRQSHYLDSLTSDALFVEGMKKSKQFTADGEDDSEKRQKELSREIIHLFVGKLKADIEQLIAFMIARYDRISVDSSIVQRLIALTNNYVAHVENLLALSDEELQLASIEKRGLFTKTFEFNKQFDDSFKTLNSYLAWD
jgi:hypothetical protein